MTFGEAGKEGARVHDLKDVEKILDIFQAHVTTRFVPLTNFSVWALNTFSD